MKKDKLHALIRKQLKDLPKIEHTSPKETFVPPLPPWTHIRIWVDKFCFVLQNSQKDPTKPIPILLAKLDKKRGQEELILCDLRNDPNMRSTILNTITDRQAANGLVCWQYNYFPYNTEQGLLTHSVHNVRQLFTIIQQNLPWVACDDWKVRLQHIHAAQQAEKP